jgi:cyanophycinase
MSPARVEAEGARGWIVPVGGAEEKVRGRSILKRFVEIAGGDEARIAVVPTASRLEDTGDRYEAVFRKLGVNEVRSLPFLERQDASKSDWLSWLEAATGVFFTGGNQLRISTILGGTPVAKTVRLLSARGVIVGGTSAGAAILSEHMIAGGKAGATPKVGLATLAPGFGLTNRVIIDQHFRQRDRIGRLLTALAYNPFAVGLGLDEDTAAFIDPADVLHVVGTGAITVVDASSLEHSTIASEPQGKPFSMTGLRLHILTEGSTYDLHHRRATPPSNAD